MADIKDWSSLGPLSSEWTEAVKAAGGTPDFGAFPDIPSLRKQMREATAPVPTFDNVTEQDHQVKMRDGHEIAVRTYHPQDAPAGALGVLYHGGGWCVGGLEDGQLLCRRLASQLGMTVANVDYRLGPEWKFPTAHHDCLDAAKWVTENASRLGADPSKGFIVAGDSAGGNLASAVSHLWQDEKLSPPITGCHLMVASLCDVAFYPEQHKKDLRSRKELSDAPILNNALIKLLFDSFIPAEQRGDQLFSPLLWKTGHQDLPPHYFQICGADPLRDEQLVLERILREEHGINTKVDVYPGQPHGFWFIFPQMNASKKFAEESLTGVQWLLEQK